MRYQVSYFLESNATRYPNRPAFRFEQTSFTWKELNKEANRLATGLISRGIRKGDTVAYLMRNCTELVVLWWALQKVGATAQPLNTFLHEDEVTRSIALSGCSLLFYQATDAFSERISAVSKQCPSIRFVRVSVNGEVSPRSIGDDYAALLAGDGAYDVHFELGEDDGSLLLFTSGTTGVSKGVLRSQRIIRDYALMMAIENENASEREVLVTACPLFHTAGMSLLMKMAALAGEFVLADGFDARHMLELVDKTRATQILLVPPSLYLRMRDANDGSFDLSTVREAQCSGGKVTSDNLAAMHELFPNARFKFSWGATETCAPTSAAIPYDEFVRRPELCGTIGTLNSMVEMRLVDDLGEDVAPGETGEALVRSSMVFSGYLPGSVDSSARPIDRDGWFHTGDMLRMDEDGYYYLMDRKADMIKTGGENVYAQEVERVISEFPNVKECAVIGVPDDYYVEAVGVVVSTKDGGHLDGQSLVEFCKEHMPSYKKPRYIAYVSELPRNSIGKIQKSMLRDLPVEAFKRLA